MAKKPKNDQPDADLPEPEPTLEAPKDGGKSVTFTGDPRGGKDPEEAEYGGKTFPKGKAVSVDADWLKANPNITGNNHFKVE